MRFFQDMKQAEIASALGISQMHVSRLLSTTCARVRRAVADEPACA
jgi:RNA polymerase sigma-B factor